MTACWTVVLNRVTEIQDQDLIQYLLTTLVSFHIFVHWQYCLTCLLCFDCLKYYTMIVLLYIKMYIIKYMVFDYLPDEDKFPC
jgi:hypothetical protein